MADEGEQLPQRDLPQRERPPGLPGLYQPEGPRGQVVALGEGGALRPQRRAREGAECLGQRGRPCRWTPLTWLKQGQQGVPSRAALRCRSTSVTVSRYACQWKSSTALPRQKLWAYLAWHHSVRPPSLSGGGDGSASTATVRQQLVAEYRPGAAQRHPEGAPRPDAPYKRGPHWRRDTGHGAEDVDCARPLFRLGVARRADRCLHQEISEVGRVSRQERRPDAASVRFPAQ